jgi:hypothetical protein
MKKNNIEYEYYYNNVPGFGRCRNNLVYTSLISKDKKIFVKWYHNDIEYHKDQNQVIDPELMDQKWNREVKYLTLMSNHYPDLIPNILDINFQEKKIYLLIDGVDFWQRSLDNDENFNNVLLDWKEQILNIIKAHRNLGLYKFSMHPSSYFIVNGKLKSINYFFTYHKDEGPIIINDHLSHIYYTRQNEMKKYTEQQGISWVTPEPLGKLENLCWDSFRTNYPIDFILKAKEGICY